MKGKIRYIVLVILLVSAWLGYYYIQNYVFKDIPTEVEKYCNNKYGGNFKWKEFDLNRSTENSKMSKVSDGEITFDVDRYYMSDGKVHYKDNYLAYKNKEYFENLISVNMPKDSTYRVSIEDSTFPTVKNGSIDVVQFAKSPETVVTININTSHVWSDEEILKFCNNFKGKFRINCFLNSESNTEHFATTEAYDMVKR